MRQKVDPTSNALQAETQHTPKPPVEQPLSIQPRRYHRGAFRIPVCIQQGSQQIYAETVDFTPGGLRLLCRNAPPLAPGSALNLTFRFSETCNLTAAGQVAYRLELSQGNKYAMGIRFADLRDWEQTIILSALKELSESDQSRQASLITMHVSQSALAQEAISLTTEPAQPSFVAAEPIISEPPSLYPERRKALRLVARVQVDINSSGVRHKATLHDVSLSGLYLTSDMPLSVNEDQPVQLGFASDVGVLDIRGTIRGIREDTQEQGNGVSTSALGIAIHYPSLDPVDEKGLASLLEEVHERPSALKLTVFLVPLGTGDLLLEISSASADAVDVRPIHPGQSHRTDALPVDRRLAERVNLSHPAWLQFTPSDCEQRVQITNFSVGGASVRLVAQHRPLERQVSLKLTSPEHVMAGEPPYEIRVEAEIIWMAQDRPAMPSLPAESSEHVHRFGLRFIYRDDECQRMIARLVGKFLSSSHHIEGQGGIAPVTSALLEHHNSRGQRIVLYHDHLQTDLSPGTPIMIIVPGYGETKKEHITLAYYLATNGFQVLRYDHTNHVGESDGDILHSTLSDMKQDLHAMLDYAERMWPASPITVIATSLASRVALKTAAEDARIKLLVLLAGVVDIQATLLAVHQEDLIGTHRNGVRRGVINVLGFNIHADDWLEDAIKGDYADLETTRSDAMQVHSPVILFTAEHDTWVPRESVQNVLSSLPKHSSRLYLIPEALHRLHENPRKARSVFRQLAQTCLEEFYPLQFKPDVREPLQSELARQNKIERERARTMHRMGKAENIEFWRDYLAHFHYIANVSDFWRLLDHIYRLAGPFVGGERILDAGCGNGNLAMFLLINQGYSQRNSIRAITRPLVYVGIDFVPAALNQARLNIGHVSNELHGKLLQALMPSSLLHTAFSLSDLNLPLPFRDHQFDRIICNLVLSYLQDPLFTLREFMRVLSPGGRLVLTNLKPQADLSQVYRNFVHASQRPEDLDEARQLLNNSGKIKQGESDGIFRFFGKDELAMLLTSASALQPRVYSTFANQAFIAVAEKRS